jgi:hypothetical protein
MIQFTGAQEVTYLFQHVGCLLPADFQLAAHHMRQLLTQHGNVLAMRQHLPRQRLQNSSQLQDNSGFIC